MPTARALFPTAFERSSTIIIIIISSSSGSIGGSGGDARSRRGERGRTHIGGRRDERQRRRGLPPAAARSLPPLGPRPERSDAASVAPADGSRSRCGAGLIHPKGGVSHSGRKRRRRSLPLQPAARKEKEEETEEEKETERRRRRRRRRGTGSSASMLRAGRMEEFVTEEEEPWYDQRDLEQGEASFLRSEVGWGVTFPHPRSPVPRVGFRANGFLQEEEEEEEEVASTVEPGPASPPGAAHPSSLLSPPGCCDLVSVLFPRIVPMSV